MAISREELLQLKNSILKQLEWVDKQLNSLEHDESSKNAPASPTPAPQVDPPTEPAEEILSPEIEFPKSDGVNKWGCIAIIAFLTIAFIAIFWVLPNLIY